MDVRRRLIDLDNRVLGKPKPAARDNYRGIFMAGISGGGILLVIAATTGAWDHLMGALIAATSFATTGWIGWRRAR